MSQFEGLLTTDSLGNVRAIEKVAMFESSVVLYGFCGRLGRQWVLSNDDRDGNENGKKSNTFRLAKQELCTCITLFWYISLPSLHDYDLKVPNFTFCGGCEHTRQRFSFSFPQLRCSPLEFISKKSCQHLSN